MLWRSIFRIGLVAEFAVDAVLGQVAKCDPRPLAVRAVDLCRELLPIHLSPCGRYRSKL